MDNDLVFKALASSIRREMLDFLKDGPQTTGAVTKRFPRLSRFAVMQHLGVLDEADLVIVQRKGRERWNHFNPLPIKHIQDRWIAPLAVQAVGVLDAMKRDLEG